VCIRGTTKHPATQGRLGERIRIGEIDIHTGDAVLGDRDGVVIIAAAELAGVASAARTRVSTEREILARLRRGETTLAVLGLPT
jgi:4-hydroxy-4-methyl-2-oxoglutarate aldolase